MSYLELEDSQIRKYIPTESATLEKPSGIVYVLPVESLLLCLEYVIVN